MEESNLKVRLVGAVVLVSLAVIFIPMILDGREVTEQLVTESAIPPRPDREFVSKVIPLTPTVEEKPSAEKDKPVIRQGLAAQPEEVKTEPPVAESAPEPIKLAAAEPVAETRPESKPQATPTSDAPSAWAVQVGSFSSKKNADALSKKLQGKGFAAFVDTVTEDGKPSFRVRIGPELKRELAEQLQKKLATVHKARTFIVKHPS